MSLPEITSHEQWLAARKELLEREKELTRARDALNADRRRLPMVRIDKQYRFAGPQGEIGLVDLFEGRRQLFLQHFMFEPAATTAARAARPASTSCRMACSPTCTCATRRSPRYHARRSRRSSDYKARKGWTFPWYSSYGSDFNYDFHATIDESVAPLEINYRSRDEIEALGDSGLSWVLSAEQPFEMPGFSCFLRDGGDVFCTYATYARGTEALGGSYAFLDLTALGRQEVWEEPQGRSDDARAAMPDFAS